MHKAPVVQRVDNVIHWIHFHPMDSAIVFPSNHLIDSDLGPVYMEWGTPV